MQGTVLSLFGAALAAGLAEMLLPNEKSGTAKLFRFLLSLVVLLLILTPFLGFLQKSEDFLTGEIPFEEADAQVFEQIFTDTVNAQGKTEFEEGLYALLEREYGLARKNVTLLVRFDAAGALSGISVYLSGAGLLQDPAALEEDLRELLGCTVEVR